MKFSDIFKKGFGAPAPADLIEGGLAIDVANKKAYSKGNDGTTFQIGLTDAEIQALNDYVDEQVSLAQPSGMISLWSGSIANIPTGWALCDGNNGTPNLLNRAVIAAGGDYSVGASGEGSIPSHSHTANHSHTASSNTTGDHVHNQGGAGWSSGQNYNATSGLAGTLNTSSAGAHSHTITVNTANVTTSVTGTGTAVVPKHYALAYIMKL